MFEEEDYLLQRSAAFIHNRIGSLQEKVEYGSQAGLFTVRPDMASSRELFSDEIWYYEVEVVRAPDANKAGDVFFGWADGYGMEPSQALGASPRSIGFSALSRQLTVAGEHKPGTLLSAPPSSLPFYALTRCMPSPAPASLPLPSVTLCRSLLEKDRIGCSWNIPSNQYVSSLPHA